MLTSYQFYATVLLLGSPFVFASVGECVSQRSGMLNIGVEGLMLLGAFASVAGAYRSGSPWVGLVIGVVTTTAVMTIQGVICITMGGNQIVTGLGLNFGAVGITTLLLRDIFGSEAAINMPHFSRIEVPFLSEIPVLGPIFFNQPAILYLAIPFVLVCWLLVARTNWGLRCKAAGENPEALDSTGASVMAVRWQALLICGVGAGLGGSAVSLGYVYGFTENLTQGQGYIAIIIVIAARWRVLRTVAVALIFGALLTIGARMQANLPDVPYQIALMLPFIVVLILYGGVARSGAIPKALVRPFIKQ